MTTRLHSGTVRHRIGSDGSFALRAISGSVRLRGSDSEEVVLVARTSSGEEARLTVRRHEGGLHVEPERRGVSLLDASAGFGQPDIDFEVELPAGARVEINSVSADVRAGDVRGDQTYRLVSGDLELARAAGRIEAKSVSGDMRVGAVGPVEIDLVTTSGDLAVQGARLDLVRMRSVSGDTAIRGGLADGPEHRVETVSGNLEIEPQTGLTVETSGPVVGLRSSISGRASFRRGGRGFVVGDGSARLRFRSMSGEVVLFERAPAASSSHNGLAREPYRPSPGRDQLDVLRAVERGELSVEEASRLLEQEVEGA